MLDIRFIRENAELVTQKSKQKGYKVDIAKLLALDEQRKKLLSEIEAARATRNEMAGQGSQPSADKVAKGKQLKEKLTKLETELQPFDKQYETLLKDVPNVTPDDTPLGGEEANREEKKWGKLAEPDFKVLDHLEWGEKTGLIDFERGAKVAGNKFYYLKGPLVELELAVFQMGMTLAKSHGFIPMAVPHLVNSRIIEGTGFAAKGEERMIYKVENQDLNLIGTAEIPLTGYHADEILEDLPTLYAGLSPAYRLEAGAYGKHARGLYRTHQFNKLELYVFCRPEDSENWHQKLVAMEEELCQQLGIPYRLVRIAAGDLGAAAFKKYDIEYWSPCNKAYHELMSCSNVTDYQARRLNIRYKDKAGETKYVHTLNGTLAAMSRIAIAIIENFQTKDGKVNIPKALQPYMQNISVI